MPIRFPTQAANADILGDDTPNEAGAAPAKALNADAKRDPYVRSRETWRSPNEGKPGKDINAAGFIKDKDAPQP